MILKAYNNKIADILKNINISNIEKYIKQETYYLFWRRKKIIYWKNDGIFVIICISGLEKERKYMKRKRIPFILQESIITPSII